MGSTGDRSDTDPRDPFVGQTGTNAGRFPVPVIAIALSIALSIALLALLGALQIFELNAEHNVPTSFSALLLASSAGLVVAYSAVVHPGEWHLAGMLMASMLAFMSLDEVATIHEHLEQRTGIDWQTLYIPVVFVAGVAWLLIFRELCVERRLAVYWVIAAAAWFVSQVLEYFEYDAADKRVRYFEEMVIAEEVLEMAGSALFGLTMLGAIHIVVRRRGSLGVSLGDHASDDQPPA